MPKSCPITKTRFSFFLRVVLLFCFKWQWSCNRKWVGLVGTGCALFVSYFFWVKAVLICCWLDEVEAGPGKVCSSNTTSPHQKNGGTQTRRVYTTRDQSANCFHRMTGHDSSLPSDGRQLQLSPGHHAFPTPHLVVTRKTTKL